MSRASSTLVSNSFSPSPPPPASTSRFKHPKVILGLFLGSSYYCPRTLLSILLHSHYLIRDRIRPFVSSCLYYVVRWLWPRHPLGGGEGVKDERGYGLCWTVSSSCRSWNNPHIILGTNDMTSHHHIPVSHFGVGAILSQLPPPPRHPPPPPPSTP